MKKYLSLVIGAITMFSALKAEAVSVGDIYFHDKTFNHALVEGKVPIGMVYWVDQSNQHGYIMGLNQPMAANLTQANTYCNGYTTLGTKVGDWKVPDLLEGLQMMRQDWNLVTNNKYNILNAKLAAIPGYGEAFVPGDYHVHATSTTTSYAVNMQTGNVSTAAAAAQSYRSRCMMKF